MAHKPSQSEITASQRATVRALMRQGETDPKRIANLMNYYDDANKQPTGGNFSENDIRSLMSDGGGASPAAPATKTPMEVYRIVGDPKMTPDQKKAALDNYFGA